MTFADSRSVAVRCILYKIRCNSMAIIMALTFAVYHGMCHCGLHAVLWSDIGILMRFFAEEPRSTAATLLSSQCPCGTILVTPYTLVRDSRVSRAGPMHFYWPSCSIPLCLLLFFTIYSF